ncbi:MAG: DUF4920 domain-containing protein [Bacteroidia bacterium]
MMKNLLILPLAIMLLGSCSEQPTENKANRSESFSAVQTGYADQDGEYYGEKFDISKAQSVDQMVKRVLKKGSYQTTVKGTVKEVCQKKGCWMKLVQQKDEDVMVTFKDYGFFVPKDISGETIYMHGTASLDTVDVATLQHYAEDAGKSQEEIDQITEPDVQMAFKADGVYLERAKEQ